MGIFCIQFQQSHTRNNWDLIFMRSRAKWVFQLSFCTKAEVFSPFKNIIFFYFYHIKWNVFIQNLIYKQACLLSQILWYKQFNSSENAMINGAPLSSLNDGCLTRWNEVVSGDSCLSQLVTECSKDQTIYRQQVLDEMSPTQRLILLKPLDINYFCSEKRELQDESLALLTSAGACGPMSGFQLQASAWLMLLSSYFKEFSLELQREMLSNTVTRFWCWEAFLDHAQSRPGRKGSHHDTKHRKAPGWEYGPFTSFSHDCNLEEHKRKATNRTSFFRHTTNVQAHAPTPPQASKSDLPHWFVHAVNFASYSYQGSSSSSVSHPLSLIVVPELLMTVQN